MLCCVVSKCGLVYISKSTCNLLICRIPWKVASDAYSNPKSALAAMEAYGGQGEDLEEDQDEDGDGDVDGEGAAPNASAIAASLVTEPLIDPALNECALLWEGVLAKRLFTGFKFLVSWFGFLCVLG